jgi:hypothetical protein
MTGFVADRGICKDGHIIGQIPEAGEKEEKQRYPFGALAFVVEKELGYSGPQIEHSAEIPKHLTQHVELQRLGLLILDMVVVMVV